jgi:hypothetical protein
VARVRGTGVGTRPAARTEIGEDVHSAAAGHGTSPEGPEPFSVGTPVQNVKRKSTDEFRSAGRAFMNP